MKTQRKTTVATAFFGALFAASSLAQSTAFTYQGKLDAGGSAANGSFDFEFALFDAAGGGTSVAGPLTNNAVAVSNGLFTTTIDFGAGVFDGTPLWLGIGVQTNGGGGFTALAPRTELTAAPYAHYAPTAGTAASAGTAVSVSGSVPAGQLSGSIPPANIGDGTIDADMLADASVDSGKIVDGAVGTTDLSGTVLSNTFWRLGGNAGTAAGTHFIGTTDDEPLDIQVNGERAVRIVPGSSGGTPSLLAGDASNSVGAPHAGVTIGGGYGQVGTNSSYATISGGGAFNRIGDNSGSATIAGGYDNRILNDARGGFVGGGGQNILYDSAKYAVIGGGFDNGLMQGARMAVIAGGEGNWVFPDARHSVIGGGLSNFIHSNATYSVIPGGFGNEVGMSVDYGFAAGKGAEANHDGTFVWSDSTGGSFASTGEDQFLIRASGGVGIGETNPDEALHVDGNVKATGFIGDGSQLSGLSADNIAAGSLDNARFSAYSDLSVEGYLGSSTWQIPLVSTADGLYVNEGQSSSISAGMLQDGAALAEIADDDGAGSGLDADLLDGQQGSYYRNISNMNAGWLDYARFSAYNDLNAENYLDNNSASDLLTRSQADGRFWKVGGNSGTGGSFIGTTDNQPVEVRVWNSRALRIEQPLGNAINWIAGNESCAAGTDNEGITIGGGSGNTIGDDADHSTIAGGVANSIEHNGNYAFIGGGKNNTIGSSGNYATILGGNECSIGTAAQYSLAAGRRAKANHQGAFVWADSTSEDFASLSFNEFAVRAGGGARFVGSSTLGQLIVAPNELSASDDSELCLAEDDDFTHGMKLKYDGGADRLEVYGKSGSLYGPHMVVERSTGDIGIGTDSPGKRLDVVDNITTHVAEFENESTSTSADGIRIEIGYSGNPGTGNDFVSFYHGGSACGSIEGNSSGGVTYSSTGADFAEYLKRLNPAESIAAGDVVALVDGAVTKALEGAQRFFVVSDMACLTGNAPAEEDEHKYTQVAFVGQVDVRVEGPVTAGDYIVAAGSGIGEAIATAELTSEHLKRLVGQAWETDDGAGVRRIRAAVGLDTTPVLQAVIANQQAAIAEQQNTLEHVLARLEKLERK